MGYAGDRTESVLDLGVAIRAQQDALLDLCSQAIDAVSSAPGDAELLGVWVEVMELERGLTPIVTAKLATAASLTDENFLRLASAANHGLSTASTAAEITARLVNVIGRTMVPAEQHRRGETRIACLARPGS